ncbi:hypothetical protein FVER53590_29258 [Fusarium verticillioides]|nr:hypothetical protein FVER53590_29258 [Fusarium verticillioides]
MLRLYFEDVLDSTLDPNPTQRSLGVILTWWREKNGPEVEWCLPDGAQHSIPIQPTFALNLTKFSQSPAALQTQIFRNLEKISQDKEDKRADEACFLLAQCYFDGIGTAESDEKGFQCLSAISSTHKAAGLALTRMRASNRNLEYCKPVATPDPATYPFQISDTPLQVLELLSQKSNLWPSSDASQNSILHWAATFGLKEHLSLFLGIFPDLIEAQNEVGETPLICAARHGNKTCVEILFDSGAKAGHTQGDTPFSAAVRNHDFDCARLLLEHGADPNQLIGPGGISTALFQVLAVEYDTTAVQFLLELPDISFNVSPQKRFTALHAPVLGTLMYNYYDEFILDGPGAVYDILLNKWNKKEHLEACEIRGYTALHWVCLARDSTSIKKLIPAMTKAGADVNMMTGFLGSPVWKTALDLINDRSSVPSAVSRKGPTAVQRYKENTEKMREMLIAKG